MYSVVKGIFSELFCKSVEIINYHSVLEDEGYPYRVTPQEFEIQMKWLSDNNFNVISLKEAIEDITTGRIKPKSVCITFDDGYVDNFENARPILERYGFKAAFFIVTGHVGEHNEWECEDFSRQELMTWSQIEQLKDDGHVIGCHTHGHINLSETNTDLITADLQENYKILKDFIKSDFLPLAYPYGCCDSSLIPLIKKVGFSCGFYAFGLLSNIKKTDLYKLNRSDINCNIDFCEFKRIVSGFKCVSFVMNGFKSAFRRLTKKKSQSIEFAQ